MPDLRLPTFLCVVLLAGAAGARGAEPGATPGIDFNRDIRPILSDKCFRCHGPDSATREAELRLDREQEAKADRDGNPVIVPGNLEESELIRRITSDDASEQMPPADSGKELSANEISTLKQWIADGADWSLPWSYTAPRSHAVPKPQLETWPLNWIDQFVLAKLDNERHTPSPDADKTTLIRRLSIDLTGLPPTPPEVETFLKDESSGAYERLIDRLLESPQFGERMATYWFDLVRYASSVGYHGDQEHHITPYRDYVIDAFNANMPFDRFTREQLAGDLLPESTTEQKIASGYNRLLQTSHEGGVQPKEYLAIYGADRVRNLSAVWLAGTMGCCQCHDHKFDPYTAKDFYSIQAFFADIDEATHLTYASTPIGLNDTPTIRSPEMVLLSDSQQTELSELETRLAILKQDETAAAANGPVVLELEKQIAHIQRTARRTMISVAIEPRTIRILPRGNWLDDSGDVVQPAVPEFMGKLNIDGRRATRLDLANWLTDSQSGVGGLTARVKVNRFWYLMFGRGLAPVLDDFGGQGEAPSHPELLDNLAIEFINCGWDTKQMLKLIAMSRTYRQSSRETPEVRNRDPLNMLLSHQGRYRFPAEVVRDSALKIGGLLVDQRGGPSSRPYQPARYYRHLNFPEREYQANLDHNQWRRGVYMHWQRSYLHPMLKAFDAPSREECEARRSRSNTPLAALVLLNDPTFVEAARSFATRILAEREVSTGSRLDFAFREAISRSPTAEEQEAFTRLLEQGRSDYADNAEAASALVSVGLKPVPENVDRAELAAWTVVARGILSLNESLTRN